MIKVLRNNIFPFWLIAIVPPLVIVAVELNKTVLIGYIRLVDFVDLTILAPFYLVVLLRIQSIIFGVRRGFSFWLGIGLIGLFLYGHAMHMTANAINTFSTEIRNYRAQIPTDTYDLIYFLDENLGHWLIYVGLFGLLGVWLLEDQLESRPAWITAVPGALVGLFQAVAIIESSHPWLGPVALIYLCGMLSIRIRARHENLLSIWKGRPVARFVILVMAAILIGEVIYLLSMGSFIQPSQL